MQPSDLDRLRSALAGQYDIERLLGQGGMGAVYLARDLTLERMVAIKVISNDIAGSATSRQRFLQEARMVAALRHPGLVTVYSAGTAGDQLYFVMEYVPGESLRDLLVREKRLAPARAEQIVHQLALALDYANAQGVVHRDVKPENILLDRESGRAMLTDFGVARAVQRDTSITGTGAILGSPRYMSPEQVTGEQTLDGRSDLYALALVGYEMCVGKPAFDAPSAAVMLVKQLTETPPALLDVCPDAPLPLAAVIDRGLRKSPDERWPTGREMAAAIGIGTPSGGVDPLGSAFGISHSGSHATASSTTGANASARRGPATIPPVTTGSRRKWMIGGAVAVALLLVVAAIAVRAPRASNSKQTFVVVPFEMQTGNRDVSWLREGAVNMLAMSIAQWRDVEVTGYEHTLDLVRDAGVQEGARVSFEAGRDIARKARAGSLVMGQVTTTADSLIVIARLYDANSGELTTDATQALAITADPRPLFDALARRLLDITGGSATASVDLVRATTTSLAAYRDYLDGLKALKGWRLDTAEMLFGRAIARDSTFALAWHKRALSLGWSDITSSEYLLNAERAMSLADRLPVRERRAVEGHAHLSRGLRAGVVSDSERVVHLSNARRVYAEAVAADSTSADVWYGLADASYHMSQRVSETEFAPLMQQAIRAFERSLVLDPELHLAYSHLLELYQRYGNRFEKYALLGDSLALASNVAPPSRLDAARAASIQKAIRGSQAWLRTDVEATPAWQQLGISLGSVGLGDSAARVLREGWRRAGPTGATLGLMVPSVLYNNGGGDVREAVREAMDSANVAQIRRRPSGDRTAALASMLSLSGAVGDSRLLEQAVQLWLATDSVVPHTSTPLPPIARWFAQVQRVAMGEEVTPELHRTLREGCERMQGVTGEMGWPFRWGGSANCYLMFIATRDTVFATLSRALQPDARMLELDAAIALVRGDSATARQIARNFPPPDSVKRTWLGLSGMRTALRAEVLAQLGDLRGAVGNYEALDPVRFSSNFSDPGRTLHVRTFAARARLYEQLGEPGKARAAYEELLRRWAVDDPVTARERAAARAAVARLRDAPTATVPAVSLPAARR